MSTLHEQARAEAEKRRYLFTTADEDENLREEFVAGAIWAATRTRVVTTVTELDALPVGTVLLDRIGRAMQVSLDSEGYRLVRRAGSDDAYYIGIDRISLPARVLDEPEEDR
ncbi:hypothetical protein ABRQ22_17330 [Cellulosimicrobium sp. ES-005]|uniref:Uncharacterized protein n=1 Tax=Cellulosimicrobium sp. ES-005 TaxID=3163031 RepID=A0AAU8FZS3_9MICO